MANEFTSFEARVCARIQAKAAIAAALLESRTIVLGEIDTSKPWRDNGHLEKLGKVTKHIYDAITETE